MNIMHLFHNRNPSFFHKIWGYIFSNHPCKAFTVSSAMKAQFSYYFLWSLNLRNRQHLTIQLLNYHQKITKCDKQVLCMSQHWIKLLLLFQLFQEMIFRSNLAAQQMKFSIRDFFSKCDQIRSLLKKSLMEIFIFCVVSITKIYFSC